MAYGGAVEVYRETNRLLIQNTDAATADRLKALEDIGDWQAATVPNPALESNPPTGVH